METKAASLINNVLAEPNTIYVNQKFKIEIKLNYFGNNALISEDNKRLLTEDGKLIFTEGE